MHSNISIALAVMLASSLAVGSSRVIAQSHFVHQEIVPDNIAPSPRSLYERVWEDHRNFYAVDSLLILGGSFAIGATMAHSSADVELQQWGERSLRSFLVGAPPMLLSQRLTGGSRPGESSADARWNPFNDNNGVSGHSFMSALPFINAAKMSEGRWLKTVFYAGSLLGPLSRVNDDAHYTSQVALGWSFAFLSATAIDRTQREDTWYRVRPWVTENGATGASIEFRY